MLTLRAPTNGNCTRLNGSLSLTRDIPSFGHHTVDSARNTSSLAATSSHQKLKIQDPISLVSMLRNDAASGS